MKTGCFFFVCVIWIRENIFLYIKKGIYDSKVKFDMNIFI